jgi:arylsulfatase A-like enzyme/Flp pilus assembly protein TadD
VVAVVGTVIAGSAVWHVSHRPSRVRGIRNVVLISIDTCRADHLSCYGFKRPTTPHIDAVALEGVIFEQALSPVPLTTPAHSSMLTGTYPPTNGVRLNNLESLAASSVTMTEVLREAGFRTAAFVGGFPLDTQFGLNQGFDTYDCAFTRKSETSSAHSERSAEEVSGPALAWLDQNAGAPFFLFLHYYDAHFPYEPPAPYASAYADDPYDGEIAHVDEWIGHVLARLRTLGAYDDTLLIITADHGESLGEHGETSHGFFIYQSTQHVPLLIRAPHARRGSRIVGRVSLVDLAPTVLDLVNLKTPAEVEGVSLRPYLEGRTAPTRPRALYCESLVPTQFGCGALYGIAEGPWKYIRAPRQELYELSHDANETNNVIDEAHPVAQDLQTQLEELLQEMESSAPQHEPMASDPDAIQRLQSLGYIGSGATPATSAFDPSLEDPKDFIETFQRLGKANTLFHSDHEQEAEAELLAIVETRPGLVAAHQQLAEIALREHRPMDAVRRYESIVSLLAAPKSASNQHLRTEKDLATAHFNLAFALREVGRNDEAIAHYENAVRIRPDYVDAHNSLGLALVRAGRYGEAIVHYERALQINPNQAQVHNNFGNVLQRTNRLPEAIDHYRQALRIKPDSISALNNLALLLAATGDPRLRNGAEAVKLAQRACDVTGRSNVNCLDTLAAAYAEAARFDEAVTTAEAAVAVARSAGQPAMADAIQSRVALYRGRRPYRIAALSNPAAPE